VTVPLEADGDTTLDHPLSIGALWFGVLAAPAAFMFGLVALYAMTSPPCERRHDLALHLVHALSVAIGISGVAVGWWMQRAVRRRSKAGTIGPGVRLLAQVGVGVNILFVLAMLAQWLAEFLIPCGSANG
jgi:hypothetical protein